jgi:hypothetical protein
MFERADVDIEKTNNKGEAFYDSIGGAAIIGASLTSDRRIIEGPYIIGEGDQADYFVDILAIKNGDFEIIKAVPFDDIDAQRRQNSGYSH